MRPNFSRSATAVVAVLFLTACKGRTPVKPPPPDPTVSHSARTPAAPDFVKAANAFEAAVMADNIPKAEAFIDETAFMDAATSGVPTSSRLRRGFDSGFRAKGFSNLLAALHRPGSTFRLLHVYQQDRLTHALYRVIGPDGAFNYSDWLFQETSDGKVSATDVYIPAEGEYFTQTVRRFFVMAAAAADDSLSAKVLGTDRTIVDHLTDITAMASDLQHGKNQDVLDIYDRFPPALQKQKIFFTYRLRAAKALLLTHPGLYEKALDQYAKQFAGDPSVDFISLDRYEVKKDYPDYFRTVDHIEAWTGGDAYLECLRGEAILEENKPGAAAQAEKVARAAMLREPRLMKPQAVLIESLACQQKYADAVAELRSYEKRGRRLLDAATLKRAKGLEQSKEYAAYRKAS